VLREDGTFVRAFGSSGTGEGMFHGPCGVCVGEDGSIVVTDSGNHRVQVFDSGGSFVRSFGSQGNEPGQFRNPFGVAVGGGGRL
jgi:tripartite motif-containing protein 71